MSKDSDDFGQRMKEYEFIETQRKFMPLLPVYCRIDGRGFSKFTKGLNRPFDERFTNAMIEVTKHLVKETHAKIGYCQSDEISLFWHSDNYDGEIFFDGKIHKLTSVLASMATTKLMHYLFNHPDKDFSKYSERMPHFDARVFQLPNKIELSNVFLWRVQDCYKNSISMAASHYYSHKELDGKNNSEKQEMLFQKGINYNDYPSFFKQGSFIKRRNVERMLTEEELLKIPVKHQPTGLVVRSEIIVMDMPIFSKVINKVDVLFDDAEVEIA